MPSDEVVQAIPLEVNIPPDHSFEAKHQEAKGTHPGLSISEPGKGWWSSEWKEARVWASIVLVGSLVGWVSVKTQYIGSR